MHKQKQIVLVITAFSLLAVILIACTGQFHYPETKKIPVTDNYHGTEITDNYRWLEDAEDPEVIAWVEAQEKLTHSLIDRLPQKRWMIDRLNVLWRYYHEGVPRKVIDGDRIFLYTKDKEQEKWVYNTKKNEDAELTILLDPNEWDPTEDIGGAAPSRDGRYLAYGITHGGDENPIYRIMDIESGEVLPDTLLGWKQHVVSWLPDNSGFYYSAKPLEGEVPEGEEYYWPSAYLHILGTPATADKKVFSHNEVKEYWHSVSVSEDGKYETFNRSLFNKNEIYFRRCGSDKPPIPMATGMDAEYSVDVVEDKILIRTDLSAPLYEVHIADAKRPQRKYWKTFIPEHEKDRLDYIAPAGGHIYAIYQHNAYTVIKVYDLQGNYLRDVELPTIGSAGVRGRWGDSDVWITFSSFNYPSTIFKYDFAQDSLILHFQPDIDIDASLCTTEQVWYDSKDGTPISMFLVYQKGAMKDGNLPVLLTGYGGFNISIKPRFSTSKLLWLEAGGLVAVPNLRGGGEYGAEWHEAGMREKKQNVFDDYIAAAEWLIENGYTRPERLALYGGSNGGLLVGAFAVQRPDLCRAIYCAVPLLDMVNYHTFGLANIWSEEYGSSEDAEQFKYIHAYSPYHHVVDGTNYPAMLITGSVNDARVDPLHARKMVARMQEADPAGNPVLLLERSASGHGGGVTISIQIEQNAEVWSFLMDQVDMPAPK